MKKIILYSWLPLFLLSCGFNPNKEKKEQTVFTDDQVIIIKETLDPTLQEGVLDLLGTKEHLKYPSIPLDSSFIAILFIVDPRGNAVNFSDSIAEIMYNVFTQYDYTYYKGMITLDSVNIAIFDRGNFGDRYYNADSLEQIPLDRFKPYPMDVILMTAYYVKNGELKFWNP